jgi:hypothetical protein
MGDDNGSAALAPTTKRTRIQSEIEFPYADLESAVELATAIHSHAGASCEDAELAAWLDQTASSGTYRSRRSAARMFGLIEITQGRVSLTQLGRDAVEGRQARIEAFLRPELFREMYEQYRGQTLPPPPAIERHMAQLGVSPKQTDRARQAFQKSAQYAGYIDPTTSRFIRPGSGVEAERKKSSDRDRNGSGGNSGGGGGGKEIDPIIRGLLDRLPNPGDVWPDPERKLWLDLLEGSFKLIYKDAPPSGDQPDANNETKAT